MQMTRELAQELISLVATGRPISKEFEARGIDPMSFERFLEANPDLDVSLARAMALFADAMAGQLLEIADTDPDPQRARNRLNVRQWLAARLRPQRYGDAVNVHISGQVNLTAALSDARSRVPLLPMRDQAPAIEAQYVEIKEQSEASTTDKQSGPPAKAPAEEPDPLS